MAETYTEEKKKNPEKKKKKSHSSVTQKIAIVIWAVLIIAVLVNKDNITAESIISYMPENIPLAVLVMMGLFALKTLSIVFYSGILFIASGIMFDLPLAIAVNIAGALVMLLEGYAIGHAGGKDLVDDLSAKYSLFSELGGLKERRPFMFALLIRMLKVVNYDLGSMYMGAACVKVIPYLGGSLTALLPEIILFALAGNGIGNMDAMPAAASVAVYAIMTVTSVFALRFMMNKQKGDK